MQLLYEPSIGLMHLRIRNLIGSRIGRWLLRSIGCRRRIHGKSLALRVVGSISVHDLNIRTDSE